MSRGGDKQAITGDAEFQAAQAVSAYLAAREIDDGALPEKYAPEDSGAAAEFWRAMEGVTILCRTQHLAPHSDDSLDAGNPLPRPPQPALRRDAIPGYEITGQLSHGGQGVVYQAIQQSTKRKVAIKVLLAGQHADASARRRFEREIDLVARLKHPLIVSIFDSDTTSDGQLYYVMDYVSGRPLHRYVQDRQLPLENTLHLFATVCDAVQYAHLRGIIHRDLKPSNVLIDGNGLPKILDFGLAKHLAAGADADISLSRDIVGTLHYMSPEQARGNADEIDTRTDIYALGVVLYKVLTGVYPYPVNGPLHETVRHINQTEPTRLRRAWRSDVGVTRSGRSRSEHCPLDAELETIVLTALSKDRERRYQSAGEFARDIRHYLAGEPIEAKRDSAWYVLRKNIQRHKGSVTIALLFLIFLISAGVMLSLQNRQLNEFNERLEQYAQTESDVKYWALEQKRKAESQQREAERAAYDLQLRLALQSPPTVRAAELARTDPAQRGWLWAHLTQEPDAAPRALAAPPETRQLSVRADDLLALDLGGDLWQYHLARNTWELSRIAADRGAAAVRALDPTGQRLLLLESDGTLRLLPLMTDAQPVWLEPTEPPRPPFQYAFSADGAQVARLDAQGNLQIWNTADGSTATTERVHVEPVAAFAFHARRSRVAVLHPDGRLTEWAFGASPGHDLRELGGARPTALAYTPDGRHLLVGTAAGEVTFHGLSALEPIYTLSTGDRAITDLSQSGDRRTLSVLTAGGRIRTWKVDPPVLPATEDPLRDDPEYQRLFGS